MAQLQHQFNAQQFDPSQQGGSIQQLPVGKHVVIATASEIKATKDNSGGMLVFDLQVIEGPGQGKSGPMRLNLYSSSDQARGIAENQYAALCYATNVLQPTDTQQHHGIPFMVEVENQPLTADQQAKQAAGQSVTPFTQVRKILNRDGSIPGMGGAAPQQQQQGNGQQWQGQGNQQPQGNQGGWNGGQQQQSQPQQEQQPQPQNQGQSWQNNQGGQQQSNQGNGSWQQGNSNQGKPAWGR